MRQCSFAPLPRRSVGWPSSHDPSVGGGKVSVLFCPYVTAFVWTKRISQAQYQGFHSGGGLNSLPKEEEGGPSHSFLHCPEARLGKASPNPPSPFSSLPSSPLHFPNV